MKCPNCQAENRDAAKFCSRCGGRLEAPRAHAPAVKKRQGGGKALILAAGAVFVVGVVVALIALLGGGAERAEPGALPTMGGEVTHESTPAVPADTAVIYLVTSSSSSEYLAEYDITLESGRQNVMRLLPDSGEMALVDWNLTASYASSSVRPYTVDGRLFIIRHTGLEHGDSHSFVEYDPRTSAQVLDFRVFDPIRWGCVAILGNQYYYQSYRTSDYMYGDQDGELKRLEFRDGTSGEGTVLAAYGDPEGCWGNLEASDGVLYDAFVKDSQIVFYRRDLTSGRPAEELGALTLDKTGYELEEIAFDEGMAYLLVRRLSDNRIDVARYDFVSDPQIVLQASEPGMDKPDYFDVDNGYVVVGDADGYVLYLDPQVGTPRLIEVGFKFYEVQVLYIDGR